MNLSMAWNAKLEAGIVFGCLKICTTSVMCEVIVLTLQITLNKSLNCFQPQFLEAIPKLKFCFQFRMFFLIQFQANVLKLET